MEALRKFINDLTNPIGYFFGNAFMKCTWGFNHGISEKDEDKLYEPNQNPMFTECTICGARLKLSIDPDDDEYFITEEV